MKQYCTAGSKQLNMKWKHAHTSASQKKVQFPTYSEKSDVHYFLGFTRVVTEYLESGTLGNNVLCCTM